MPLTSKNYLPISIVMLAAALLIFSAIIVFASSKNDIVFPVQELGGCENETGCRAYCDEPENSRVCLAFVKKHNLVSQTEIAQWEKFIDVVEKGGPGNCRNEKECVSYCEDSSRIVECTDFVAKYDLVSREELAEMQKIAKAVKAGAKLPGNCRGKAACITYCEDSAHVEECALFLEKTGLISPADANFMRKAQGKSPGDCARGSRNPEEGKRACSAFCSKNENQKVCMDFAVRVGLISAEDAKEMSEGGSVEDFNACLPHIDQKTMQCFDVLGKEAFEKMKAGQVPDEFKDMKEMLVKIKEVRSCINKGIDESFKKLPSGGLVCLEKELGENPIEKIKSGGVSCQQFSGMRERMSACFADQMGAELEECLGLSCSEVAKCVNDKSGGGGQSEQGNQSQLDPIISDKLDKIKEKINACATEQIRECLAKDCAGMMSCISKLKGEGGDEQEGGESDMNPALKQEVTAKVASCMEQQGGPNTQCTKQGGVWDGTQCDFSAKGAPASGDQSRIPEGYSSWEEFCKAQIDDSRCTAYKPQIDCSVFAQAPSCSYVGSPDSQSYKLCKQCYPDR